MSTNLYINCYHSNYLTTMCQIYQFSHYLYFHLKQPRGMLVNLTSILYIFSAQLSFQKKNTSTIFSHLAFSHFTFLLNPNPASAPNPSHSIFAISCLTTIQFCLFKFEIKHFPFQLFQLFIPISAFPTVYSYFSFSHCLFLFQLFPLSISHCLFLFQLFPLYSHFNFSHFSIAVYFHTNFFINCLIDDSHFNFSCNLYLFQVPPPPPPPLSFPS